MMQYRIPEWIVCALQKTWRWMATIVPLVFGLHAQQAAAPPAETRTDGDSGKVIKLEAVSVTGSYLKRLDIEKVLPVSVINKEALEFRNAFTPIDQLTALP